MNNIGVFNVIQTVKLENLCYYVFHEMLKGLCCVHELDIVLPGRRWNTTWTMDIMHFLIFREIGFLVEVQCVNPFGNELVFISAGFNGCISTVKSPEVSWSPSSWTKTIEPWFFERINPRLTFNGEKSVLEATTHVTIDRRNSRIAAAMRPASRR